MSVCERRMLSSERHSARSVLWLANDEQWRRLAVEAKVLFRWNALEEIATIETSDTLLRWRRPAAHKCRPLVFWY